MNFSDWVKRVLQWLRSFFQNIPQPSIPPSAPAGKDVRLWNFGPDGAVSFRTLLEKMPVPDIADIAAKLHLALEQPEQIRFPFHLSGNNSPGVHFLKPADLPEHPVWFVGDIHGDCPAMTAVCEYIFEQDPESVICFCGDLIDRGDWSLETAASAVRMILDKPGQILWLKGNHEDALKFRSDTPAPSFFSKVKPAGFAEFLNEHPEYASFGQDLIRFFGLLPTAVFFPDGLLFTHAGVPMDDLFPKLTSPESFSDPAVLTDFAWIRIDPDTERKKVSRVMKGNTAGRVNIDDFFAKCTELNIPAKRIIAGHIHPRGGYVRAFEKYTQEDGPRYPRSRHLLSVTILHDSVTPEFSSDGPQPIAAARYCPDQNPDVKLLHFEENVLNYLYKFQSGKEI